jgi:hypothetical protein
VSVGVTPRLRWTLAGSAAALALLLVVANAHLVTVARASDPGCVPHLKARGDGTALRAAKSAC